ncbi:MAG: o-succinylbenzoate synthase [Planctomycetales bacterium]
MKIDGIELYHVAMPLIYPWRTAYGEDATIHSLFCRLSSGGTSAWSESCPLAAPCYSPEWADAAFGVASRWMAPLLIGQEIPSGEVLQQKLSLFKGNVFAKAAFDMAWWNLQAVLTDQPLHRLLGATRDEVPVGADFGVMDQVDELLPLVADAVAQKFPRVKLKFRPGWDLDMLRQVRKQHPTHPIHIDCNSGYRLKDIPLFQQVDEFQLAMIEQPLQHDDLLDHSKLQKQIRTPVCLDESITTVRGVEQAIELGSCRYVNIKPGRVGGLTNAKAIHDRCRDAGIPCWVGGMLESATGIGSCIALAMLENFTYPADIFPSSRFYHQDLACDDVRLSRLPDGTPSVKALEKIPPPHPERLKQQTVQKFEVRA